MMENVPPQTLATAHPRVKKKASRISRLSRLYYLEREATRLLAQHGLLGRRRHVIHIFLGGMVLRGNPVVE